MGKTAKFTPAQAKMIKASEPSDRDPTGGAGVELRGAGMFVTARRLQEMKLGVIDDNTGDLFAGRAALQAKGAK